MRHRRPLREAEPQACRDLRRSPAPSLKPLMGGDGVGDPGLHRSDEGRHHSPLAGAGATTPPLPRSRHRSRRGADLDDVEGILTADLRDGREPMPILDLSFREAAELAPFGAKVLHPRPSSPRWKRTSRSRCGTPCGRREVQHHHRGRGHGSPRPATAIASRGPIQVITIESTHMLAQSGFLARIFEVFGRPGFGRWWRRRR